MESSRGPVSSSWDRLGPLSPLFAVSLSHTLSLSLSLERKEGEEEGEEGEEGKEEEEEEEDHLLPSSFKLEQAWSLVWRSRNASAKMVSRSDERVRRNRRIRYLRACFAPRS
uniref:Uncharacterized protein n=1 Tax=Ananas comosus var. bracteatus TaxID=296719 RepID=A0A6V7P1S6_ANACO|nr:unnamed protein product [Ananas comosus var. bracteatus]